MISAYADSLAALLGFDRSLAKRVRQEVEDHLHEAVAADTSGDSVEAQRRAIANFGDPGILAAQWAMASLAGQARRIGAMVVLVIGIAFLAMASRLAWYDLTQWAVCEAAAPFAETIGLIDQCAFWLALTGGVTAWALIARGQAPAAFDAAYRERLRFFLLLCKIAAGALIVSALCDGILTAIRLSGWEFSAYFVIPLLSMAIEVACTTLLLLHLRGIALRVAPTAALART